MLVRQLVGRLAGEVIDLPYAVATSCLAMGTAALPDAEVAGVRSRVPPAASAPRPKAPGPHAAVRKVLAMAGDGSVRFLNFKSAAAEILGSDLPAKKGEIIAALESRLA